MRVLGVSCASNLAYLVLLSDGGIVQDEPLRLETAVSTDEDAALWETLKSCQEALDVLKPQHVVLLLPATDGRTKQKHDWWRPRIEFETLLRMAASERSVPLDRLARPTVRSALGAAADGDFEKAVAATIPDPGKYGSVGRIAAAAAAFAYARKG